MKKILILILSVTLLGCNNDKEEIINTYNNFNKANIELNGEKLYELSDSESHIYYDNLLIQILELDSIGVSKLNLTDKINLLSARSVIKDSELKKISSKELMIKMYTEVNTMDTVKINAIKKMTIANIRIENGKATSDFATNGTVLSPKVNLKFSKENGKWKYNLVSMSDFTEKQLKNICEQNGFSHMDFIKLIFADPNVQNKKIKELDDIWNPTQK
jgi:hypothetical protein|tara:strand:+ start:801 stop:1451 length:651 start_codon:yes stop_codon:yes gene_type:complete